MSCDKELSTTTNVSFAVLCCYAFGFESLHTVSTASRTTFGFCVPSLDFQQLQTEFNSAEDVPVMVNQFCKVFQRVNQVLREARANHDQWVSADWIAGK